MSNQPMTAEELLEIIAAAPGKMWECDGESVVADVQVIDGVVCSHPICDIDYENQDDFDRETWEYPESSEAIAKAIITAHNEAPRIIRALLARVAELEPQVTPRPIEEAPKDERVLVFCPEESDYGYTAAWVIGEKVVDQWEGDMRLEDGVQPTHWLPLPPDWIEVTDPTEVTK